jgi:hypothetical protein
LGDWEQTIIQSSLTWTAVIRMLATGVNVGEDKPAWSGTDLFALAESSSGVGQADSKKGKPAGATKMTAS